MQSRFDRLFEVFFEPLELIEDERQRERLSRLFGVSRPGLERAIADLVADVLDDVNRHLDDIRVEVVFRGSDGGFAVEVKERSSDAAREPDDDDVVASTADAEKLTLRLPPGLKERAAAAAAAEGVSLNSWIVRAISRQLGAREGRRDRDSRTSGGSQLRGWVGG